MHLRDDYSGEFDPDLDLSDFSRQALATLGREYLLHGHLQDRVGLPLVAQHFGGEAYGQCAIAEWMSASPIYSQRMQRALAFEGHDVSTAFKNLQLDIGAPHQFMDFQFRLDSPDYGEFWLPHCGALLDVEPFGEKLVRLMCHDIEDPTFDATAAATHPCMKVRPIHRPPRVPEGRYPACRWKVFIDEDAVENEEHPNLAMVKDTKIATISIPAPGDNREAGGWDDYSGPFDPGFQLEDLSHRALIIANQEFAVQSHILARAFLLYAGRELGDSVMRELGSSQWTGIAALSAERIRNYLGIEGEDIAAIAKVFQMHPSFIPRSYIDFRVEITGEKSARIIIGDSPALQENDGYSWLMGLGEDVHPALDAIAGVINARASCRPASPPGSGSLAWDIVIDPNAEERKPPEELQLAKMSRGATFRFEQRRIVR